MKPTWSTTPILVVLSVTLSLVIYKQLTGTLVGKSRWWESLQQDYKANLSCGASVDTIWKAPAKMWNLTKLNQTATGCPNYFNLISADLAPWSYGITLSQLAQGSKSRVSLRVTIVGGKLYFKVYGNPVQSRPIFTLWGLLQLLERYPGQIPDVDFLVNCRDRPIVPKLKDMFLQAPILSYCRTDKDMDVLIPDFSYWGWPEVDIAPWEHESKAIFAGSDEVDWKDRLPSAFWRGDVNMGTTRKELMKCSSAEDGIEVHAQNWGYEWATGLKNSKFSKQCNHRYNIYAEGISWSASLKYRMACGSTMLNIASKYYDFFSRALLPGYHYLDVPKKGMCDAIRKDVHWGNAEASKAEEIGRHGREFLSDQVSMDRVYDYWFHLLNHYAKLQRFAPKVPSGAQILCREALTGCAANDAAKRVFQQSKSVQTIPCTISS